MMNHAYLKKSYTNFLHPTYSYTVCILSFLTGLSPTKWTTVSYNFCFNFDFIDLTITDVTNITRIHHSWFFIKHNNTKPFIVWNIISNNSYHITSFDSLKILKKTIPIENLVISRNIAPTFSFKKLLEQIRE